MGKLAKTIGDNLDVAFSAVGAVGFGTCAAVFSDAGDALREHTVGTLLLASAAACIGFFAARFLAEWSRWAKRREAEEREREAQRKKVERLSRVFASMSPRRKKLVAQALDEGSVCLPVTDPDALGLCQLGVLGAPPLVGITTGVQLGVQPSVVLEVKEHRAEWLEC